MSLLNILQQPKFAPLICSLALVGAGLLVQGSYRFSSFVWFHCLRPSSIRRFVHGPGPAWAVVTGASDGIGKAVATELYDKGFNVIIHGRNEAKVRLVAEGIRTRGPRDVRYFIADASKPGHDFAKLMEPFQSLNITVVIHNVGGTIPSRERLDGCSEEALVNVVHFNDIFPLLLTRTLLPGLRASGKHGPVEVQFVGSIAADMSSPRTSMYSGVKALLRSLARGLDLDERVWEKTNVRFAYLHVGPVSSNAMRVQPSLLMPSSETFAKSVVSHIGCGRTAYGPYMWHMVLAWVLGLVGEKARQKFATHAIEQFWKSQDKRE